MGSETAEALSPGRPAAPSVVLASRPAADWWRRAAARALDALTVLFVLWAMVVLQVLWFMGDLSARHSDGAWGRMLVPTVAYVVLYAFYEIVFVARNHGQTPGRDLCRIRVVRADSADPDDIEVGWARSMRRWLVPGVLWLVPPAWLAALLVSATGGPAVAGRRSVPDLLAGTRVVPYDRDDEDPTAPRLRRAPRRWREAMASVETDAEGHRASPIGDARPRSGNTGASPVRDHHPVARHDHDGEHHGGTGA